MIRYSVQFAALAGLLLTASAAQAATGFTDRNAFIAATSPQAGIDFNGTVPFGSSYRQQDLTVGNMTLNAAGGFIGFNVIAPGGQCADLDFDKWAIDGSPYACSYVDAQVSLNIDFNAPVTSWGADFRRLGDDGQRVELAFLDDDSNVIADFIAEGNDVGAFSFIGLDFQGQETSQLVFSYLFSNASQAYDIFGMDNVLFSTARGAGTPNPVPVPPAMLLFASAGTAFAALRRCKTKS
ncbi:MAG: hypothetical protein AAF607_04905 [Pseudomonadota bacterium]